MIEIWQPRYRDNSVLIASYKVASGINEIRFTRARHLAGMTFRVRGEQVAKCKMECVPKKSGGFTSVYVVPMEMLERADAIQDSD